MHVVEKGVSVTPLAPVAKPTGTASPATSVEEISPLPKRQRMVDKGKEKATSQSSSVWDDLDLMLTRAQDAFTIEELKVFSGVPSNKIVNRYIYKLVQVMYLFRDSPLIFFFLIVLDLVFRCWGDHPYHLRVLEQ